MYVLLLDDLERAVLNERQVVATLLASGRWDGELPNLGRARIDFDTRLAAEPVPPVLHDVEELELRQVLGVA